MLLSAGGSLSGPAVDNARMTLRNTTDLTLGIGADSRIALVGGAGSAPGPELVNLDITRTRDDGTFVLDGLSPTQTLALSIPGGVRASPSTAAAARAR